MIFFFYGANTYEGRQQLAKLRSQYQQKSGSDLGLERIDGSKATLNQIRAAVQAVPFLANSRLVIIEQLAANKSVSTKIADIIRDVPATTIAVFYDPAVDQRTAYFKTLSAKARTVEFGPLSQSKLVQWAQRTIGAEGGQIDRPALGRLLELVGEDQWRLSNEIVKLVQYNPHITAENVAAMVESSQVESIFNLVEAMTMGRAQEALRLYHQLREDGQSEMYILSMVIWQLRNLLLAKAAGKITPPLLAKQAAMSPYVAAKMLAKRHLYTEEQLTAVFSRAVDTDYRIKTGAGEGGTLVEQLIFEVAQTIQSARSLA
jgi:DNA polymerase-3 subunit delta